MHDDYDRSSKWLIQHRGDALLKLGGIGPIESWRPLQADVVQPRQLPDGLLEVRLVGNAKPRLHLVEIATFAEERLYEQVLRGALLVYLDRRELPEVVTVILRPRGSRGLAGKHWLTSPGGWTRFQCSWRVIKLWKLAAADLLAANDIGLIPWVPLTRFAGEPEVLLQKCRQRIDTQALPEEKANFLAVTQVLARLRYNNARLLKILGGHQIMIDSPLIREVVAEGVQDAILAALKARFGPVPAEVELLLRPIQDKAKLTELVEKAALCKDMAAFRRSLKS